MILTVPSYPKWFKNDAWLTKYPIEGTVMHRWSYVPHQNVSSTNGNTLCDINIAGEKEGSLNPSMNDYVYCKYCWEGIL